MNVAESMCDPTANVAVTAAVPPDTVAVPSDVAPSKNCTDPAADNGLTVAVRSPAYPLSSATAGRPTVT